MRRNEKKESVRYFEGLLLPLQRPVFQYVEMTLKLQKKLRALKLVKDGTIKLVELGDLQYLGVILNYCFATDFTYQTLKQRDAWIKYEKTLKAKTGFGLEFDYLYVNEALPSVFMVDANMNTDLARKMLRGEMPPSLLGIKWGAVIKHPDFEVFRNELILNDVIF